MYLVMLRMLVRIYRVVMEVSIATLRIAILVGG